MTTLLSHHKRGFGLFASVILAALLCGCGTTSGLKSKGQTDLSSLGRYTEASVLNFVDRTKPPKKAEEAPAHEAAMQEKCRHFADLIATELEQTGTFSKVHRVETAAPGSLVITGEITRSSEGNSGLRLWIGFGAGSSYFDATVRFTDSDSGSALAEVVVDRNSWGGGGMLAAGQTVESFMQAAAEKIAAEVQKARAGKR